MTSTMTNDSTGHEPDHESHDERPGSDGSSNPVTARPRRRRPTRLVAIGAALAITLIVAASIGVARDRSGDDVETTADEGVVDVDIVASQQNPNPESLDELIAGLQTRLAGIPNDHTAWAALGLAYVQQAKATANPAFYPRADGALAESIALDADSNFLAYAGRSALASARHDFAAAKEHAEAGLAINAFSAPLHGALGDAELQLGNYDGAIEAVGRMSELRPDTASFARESYLWELRGNVDLATRFMESAREAAPTPADEAFAVFHLGELAFDQGDPTTALDLYNVAQSLVPGDPASLAGKAKAEAALGQVETALDHYARVVTIAPEPAYVTAYAELLDSLGRDDAAAEQYAVVAATEALFAENGVAPDAGPLLFLAEHGDPAAALAGAEAAIAERPFLAMYDAYAWALHKNGRHDEALVAIDEALALGTRNASYLYHSGMIKHALGDMPGAVADLTAALETNPHFDPLAAPIASETLAELVEQGVGS